jgi:hypothetical protein
MIYVHSLRVAQVTYTHDMKQKVKALVASQSDFKIVLNVQGNEMTIPVLSGTITSNLDRAVRNVIKQQLGSINYYVKSEGLVM